MQMTLDLQVCERARLARDPRFDGRFFIAVTTTGIYCRPICPAPSPKSSNVRYYPSAAAAAEAGFRPCLRCRPEASPGTPAWLGASSTVSRALKLIGESALDGGGVDTLAERLGIGARHLRRLFLKYLGATPIAVAQTRRVHFAKKLIDETRLPMTQIAMAAGFGSVRRIFDLGADPAEVTGCFKRDERLRVPVRTWPGLRVPGCWDGFEIGVRAILGQQVTVKAASTMAGRLVTAFGSDGSAGSYEGARLFPTADTLASADLAAIGLTRQRAATIRELAENVALQKIALDNSIDCAEFEQRITTLRGIGPWTAQYIAMRLGEPDAFPSGDLYLREFAQEAEAWRPWRAYAAMYLWRQHVA